jgi:hypothetical protein
MIRIVRYSPLVIDWTRLLLAAFGAVAATLASACAKDDTPTRSSPVRCDPGDRFAAPLRLDGSINNGASVEFARVSADGRELYLAREAAGQSYDLFVATRPSLDTPFGAPVPLAGVNTTDIETSPTTSSDGLTLLFHRYNGETHLYSAKRVARTDPFPAATPISELNAPGNFDGDPYLIQDGKVVYFTSQRRSAGTIYRAARPSADAAFGAPIEIAGNIPTTGAYAPVVSEDELVLYYTLSDGAGGEIIYVATRPSTSVLFDAPKPVPELNRDKVQYPSWLSTDGCILYFAATSGASLVMYAAAKTR